MRGRNPRRYGPNITGPLSTFTWDAVEEYGSRVGNAWATNLVTSPVNAMAFVAAAVTACEAHTGQDNAKALQALDASLRGWRTAANRLRHQSAALVQTHAVLNTVCALMLELFGAKVFVEFWNQLGMLLLSVASNQPLQRAQVLAQQARALEERANLVELNTSVGRLPYLLGGQAAGGGVPGAAGGAAGGGLSLGGLMGGAREGAELGGAFAGPTGAIVGGVLGAAKEAIWPSEQKGGPAGQPMTGENLGVLPNPVPPVPK